MVSFCLTEVEGAQAPRLKQQVVWNAKKALKAAPFYTEFRKMYFETRRRVIQS